jgi:uncharacterized protein YndB with AHSA1/START domain
MLDKPSLTIKRKLKAPPAKVYEAWTDPKKIARWFGPEGIEVVSAECDARVGGRFRVVMRAPDGETHDVSGTYREVVPGQKLVFSWAWISTPERESLVTVLITGDSNESMLTLKHEQFFDEPARDRHHYGWSGAIDKLERLFT